MNAFKMGFLIAFEGVEAANTDVFAKDFFHYLREEGEEVGLVKSTAPLNCDFRLAADCLQFFLSSLLRRAMEVEDIIQQDMKKDRIVICNQFTEFTLACYREKLVKKYIRGYFTERIVNQMCALAAYNLKPDLTVFVDCFKKDIKLYKKTAHQRTYNPTAFYCQKEINHNYILNFRNHKKEWKRERFIHFHGAYNLKSKKRPHDFKKIYRKIEKLREGDSYTGTTL